jgi:hypothetical protein
MRFFFFGTLLDEEVLNFVVGRKVPAADKRPANLAGFRRVKAQGVTYPIVVRSETATVSGMLVSSLTSAEARRLIDYEGANYDLVTLPVLAGIRQRQAQVFIPVVKGGLTPLDEDWMFEEWARLHRDGFVARLRQWKTADRAV